MNAYDLTPLFRSTVGFDQMMRMMDSVMQGKSQESSYPPYNITKLTESAYQIDMALAGFTADDVDVTLHQGTLIITGKPQEKDKKNYLYQGIAKRTFERRFQLADFMQVKDVFLSDGLLTIFLEREVPEAMKPQKLKIQSVGKQEMKAIEAKTKK